MVSAEPWAFQGRRNRLCCPEAVLSKTQAGTGTCSALGAMPCLWAGFSGPRRYFPGSCPCRGHLESAEP